MYQNPFAQASIDDPGNTLDMSAEEQEYFDAFYEDVYLELWYHYGDIEEMNVCGNVGDHLIGNVYVKFRFEDDADKCVKGLNKRWYNGQPIYAELSPVTDFREASCRQYAQRECTRGGFCNFLHLLKISDNLRRKLRALTRKRGVSTGDNDLSLVHYFPYNPFQHIYIYIYKQYLCYLQFTVYIMLEIYEIEGCEN
ncbi:Splicing factor U2AF 26 kDa subunit [Thelohanellus kitauei]|uniref:Splicing factor U2AF 26 kDa subunit n=1 Tax=Thelohanellus kitauei TaxID=669202 RepID=A0A0C2MYC7_THEKT|nr:Splicing factor U2AF 26 kDa subunit [Thelohanellus kitauei]